MFCLKRGNRNAWKTENKLLQGLWSNSILNLLITSIIL